jgi:hypothetical protein
MFVSNYWKIKIACKGNSFRQADRCYDLKIFSPIIGEKICPKYC